MTEPEIEKICNKIKSELLEHVDSVRVFVTFHEGGNELTKCFTTGGGNLYAQLGAVKEWVVRQDEYVRLDAKRD